MLLGALLMRQRLLNEKEKKKAIARKEKAFKKKERLEEKAPEKPLRQPRNQVVAQEKHPS
jgi:hypothetical protein